MEKKTLIIVVIALIVLAVCAFVVLMVAGVVLWQLGVFSATPQSYNAAIGFSKIKPFDASIQYESDGALSFVVANVAGYSIQDVTFSFSGDCEGLTYSIGELSIGETSDISVDCTPNDAGSSFSTDVSITYNALIAGQSISYEDSRRIQGIAE